MAQSSIRPSSAVFFSMSEHRVRLGGLCNTTCTCRTCRTCNGRGEASLERSGGGDVLGVVIWDGDGEQMNGTRGMR
jgi:hypothetical protein